MAKKELGKYVTEHILELRHEASGRFLDLRGKIADHIKEKNFFKHWRIQDNTISFFDSEKAVNSPKAIISYNKIVVITQDPPTQNYFQDQSLAFLKTIDEINDYTLPGIRRFGARTKCYIPGDNLGFSDVYDIICQKLFNSSVLNKIGGATTDLQLVLDFKDKKYNGRIILGPVKENEANRYFSFTSDEFRAAGLYIDIDIFQNEKIRLKEIRKILNEAMLLTWKKVEDTATSLGV